MTIRQAVLGSVAALVFAGQANAEMRPSLSFAGVTGLIDMPSGEQQSDGALAVTKSVFGPFGRTTLTFQISPRLSGSFRYTSVRRWNQVAPSAFDVYYDRSFDVRYQVLRETKYLPAVTLGFQDVIGTGIYSGEYIAATKNLGEKVKLTAGLGWGRYGSYGSIGAPFGTRPAVDFGLGGKPRLGQWFRGDMAPFAGIEWQMTPKLTLKAEYSSDNYDVEAGQRKTFARNSPLNFGIEYGIGKSGKVGLYSLYGSQLGVAFNLVLDPKTSPIGGSIGPAPTPVGDRSVVKTWAGNWADDQSSLAQMRDALQSNLQHDGIVVEALAVTETTAYLRIRNTQLENSAQVIGRAARALSVVMPGSVERFDIVPVAQGVALSQVSIRRSDLEALEFAPGQDATMRDRAQLASVGNRLPEGAVTAVALYPKFSYRTAPYISTSLFDPDNPLRADLGIRLTARYDVAPGMFFAGSFTKKIIGNIDSSKRASNSVLPHVRTDFGLYSAEGDPAIEKLTFAWYGKPGQNLYSRVTVGYLERMFGGVSGELLWQQPDKPYALGVEVNYVKQRNYDQLFGFRDYAVATGHVSAYYAFKNGYHAQLDVGRYLAGDVGATLSIDREFANGWKVGAFMTLTNVPFKDFGEGSFDKGIRLEIPLAWVMGKPTQKAVKNTLRPLSRDGGARLEVDDRLYETVRPFQGSNLDAAWGRFWR